MSYFSDSPKPVSREDAAHAPASCPSCGSKLIVTTSKTPDADSYWRCTRCGDVWNDGRRSEGARHWRRGQ